MAVHDELGLRMKHNYEEVSKTRLVRRMPVAIRIDGKAFHTFTRGFAKPFDPILIQAMQATTKFLCENIQGCVFGYTQSDEITLILVDYQKLTSAAWFDNEVQKICSISASMATLEFNRVFSSFVENFIDTHSFLDDWTSETSILASVYRKQIKKGAMFDSRCFNIPKEEVTNLIYWRQLDAMRNSIQMVGQSEFSHQYLQNMSCSQIKEELKNKVDTKNWEDYPIMCQRGTAVKRDKNGHWIIDMEMPILTEIDRDYVEELIMVGE